jgi:LacI family transcriptional regulator
LPKFPKIAKQEKKLSEKPNGSKAAKPVSGAATIYDIAELAGVNPSTVSRALTTPGRISAKTEAKIKAAAKELNYVVNPFARALPTGRTNMIALLMADITNPVFFGVIRGAEEVAAKHGYVLVIAESQESSEGEADIVQRILPTVDAILFVTTRLQDDEIRRFNEIKPTVLVNQEVEGVRDVVPDFNPGTVQAVQHLKVLGHKRVAFLSGPTRSWMSRHRWQLLMNAAVEEGLSIVEIGPNSPDLKGGSDSLDRILAAGVTAVVTYNDIMAIGLLKEAKRRSVSVPEDLSIIGFDNIFGSDFTTPALTTVHLPLDQLGRDGINLLLDLLDKDQETVPMHQSELQTSLLVRDSTAKAKA